jgi:hypothetical protein
MTSTAAAVRSGADSASAAISAEVFFPSSSPIHVAARTAGSHEVHDALPVEAREPVLGHHPAEVEHGDPVGNFEDVVEIVGNDHDGQPVVLEPPDQVQHHPRLGHAESRRGLVQQHQFRVPHDGLRHSDGLALASRQSCDGLADRAHCGHMQARQGRRGRSLHVVLVEEEAANTLATEKHVLNDVEVVGQGQILVDGLDSQRRRVPWAADVDRPSLPEHLAFIRLMDAGDAFGQDRLAGAVVAA